MFTHEKFRAYQKAIVFYRLALNLISDLPPVTGKSGHSDRRRFYLIARGSAMECAALCEVAKEIDCELEERCDDGKEGLGEVVGMLTVV
jgi:hypothetical protein